MSQHTLTTRTALTATAAAAAVALGAGVVGFSSAATADKTVKLDCNAPVVGAQQLSVALKADYPDQVKPGDQLAPKLSFQTTVPPAFASYLPPLGATQMDFTADLTGTWSGAITGPAQGKISQTASPVPASGDWQISGTGDVAPIAAVAGESTLSIGDTSIVVTPKDGAGKPLATGALTIPCTLAQGEDPTLIKVTVGGGYAAAPAVVPALSPAPSAGVSVGPGGVNVRASDPVTGGRAGVDVNPGGVNVGAKDPVTGAETGVSVGPGGVQVSASPAPVPPAR